MMNLNQSSIDFITAATNMFGPGCTLNRSQIQQIVDSIPGMKYPYWFVSREEYRAGRGEYNVPLLDQYYTSNAGPTDIVSIPASVTQETLVTVSQPPTIAPTAVIEATQYLRMAETS